MHCARFLESDDARPTHARDRLLLAASALCVALVEIRTHETGDSYYRFLDWNRARVGPARPRDRRPRARRGDDVVVTALLVLWLLFPNAVPA